MLRISGETNLKPDQVLQQAAKVFTKDYGLLIKEQTEDSVELEGAGGGILVKTKAGEKKTEVEIVTNEWEEPVKEYMRYLKNK
jgi:hypothetical protein